MSEQTKPEILVEFDGAIGGYSDLCDRMVTLVRHLLAESGIQVHSVTHRVKSRKSFEGKLARPDRSYSTLSDVTDLAGLRITTYFADDVDVAANVIAREFTVDAARSVDKRRQLEPDRFGYMSAHFVVTLSPSRVALPEYKRFESMRVEIQVRSILQHAWAEIEHDLGYKATSATPATVRRQFARLAGLLELVDDEFASIRNKLRAHEIAIADQLRRDDADVELDVASLRELLDENDSLKALDVAVAEATADSLIFTSVHDEKVLEVIVRRLALVGVASSAALISAVRTLGGQVPRLAAAWLADEGKLARLGRVSRGIGVFYLTYLIVAIRRDDAAAKQYFAVVRPDNRTPKERSDRLFAIYERLQTPRS